MAERHGSGRGLETSVTLWEGCRVTFDPSRLAAEAISVKGCAGPDPVRFLEIFGNLESSRSAGRLADGLPDGLAGCDSARLKEAFYPRIPGVNVSIGPGEPQPPYRWSESVPYHICRSLTYNYNAIYRLLSNLSDQGRIRPERLSNLLDRTCLLLGQFYRLDDGGVMKSINNNLNMYFISKAVELVVGKAVYDSECQELENTLAALAVSLRKCAGCASLSTRDKMAFAIGSGVGFFEERICGRRAGPADASRAEEATQAYIGKRLAIDHRDRLLAMIDDAARLGRIYSLVVVFDDAGETVADLLWIEDLLASYPYLRVTVLVNTAQISINFSSHMLAHVLGAELFRSIAKRYREQLRLVTTYCPLISFQTNFLTPAAAALIAESDVVFVKGANFFETLQLPDKDTFYAFTVLNPVARACTGLDDFDAVWAFVPAGTKGYQFSPSGSVERTLMQTVGQARGFA